jgi:hypothetical protein
MSNHYANNLYFRCTAENVRKLHLDEYRLIRDGWVKDTISQDLFYVPKVVQIIETTKANLNQPTINEDKGLSKNQK